MATLYVTEFGNMAVNAPISADVGGVPQIARVPAIAEQVVSFTTAAQSSAFNANTRFVRVYASDACHLAFSDNPTATTSSMPMAAASAEYFAVAPGQKLSVVAA